MKVDLSVITITTVMKKKILVAAAALLCVAGVNAQYNFVVQNNSSTSVYKTIDEAYTNASAGDTIYLPGGSFNMPAVDKSLTWIGVGYHPDSCNATYFTRINNATSFTGNCDNMSISGVHFSSNLSFGSSGNPVENLNLSRCYIAGTLSLKYNDGTEATINSRVSECIVDGTLTANRGGNIIIEKCIVRGVSTYFRTSVFDRTIFTLGYRSSSLGYSYEFQYTNECLMKNCVFNYYSYTNWNVDAPSNLNNTFWNNIFAGNITFPQGTNTGEDNLTGVDLSTVFVGIVGNIYENPVYQDFHLAVGSPAIGAGLDGTDIGIYGGTDPFKEGGLPSNPHIRAVNIGTETTNGILSVEISAISQDN